MDLKDRLSAADDEFCKVERLLLSRRAVEICNIQSSNDNAALANLIKQLDNKVISQLKEKAPQVFKPDGSIEDEISVEKLDTTACVALIRNVENIKVDKYLSQSVITTMMS